MGGGNNKWAHVLRSTHPCGPAGNQVGMLAAQSGPAFLAQNPSCVQNMQTWGSGGATWKKLLARANKQGGGLGVPVGVPWQAFGGGNVTVQICGKSQCNFARKMWQSQHNGAASTVVAPARHTAARLSALAACIPALHDPHTVISFRRGRQVRPPCRGCCHRPNQFDVR